MKILGVDPVIDNFRLISYTEISDCARFLLAYRRCAVCPVETFLLERQHFTVLTRNITFFNQVAFVLHIPLPDCRFDIMRHDYALYAV